MSKMDRKTIIHFNRDTPKVHEFGDIGVLDGFYFQGDAHIKVGTDRAVRLVDAMGISLVRSTNVVPRQLTITVAA